jgi:hypothetical protein
MEQKLNSEQFVYTQNYSFTNSFVFVWKWVSEINERTQIKGRIWGCHTGDYEEYCILGYNENQPTFRKGASPLLSGLNQCFG